MKQIWLSILIIIALLMSCSIGKQGVFYGEMPREPFIEIYENKIIVNTENSIENSALSIYKIDLSIDTINKTVQLKGFQAAGKDFKNKFELRLNGKSKKQLSTYKYIWIDPDNTKHSIINK